YKEFSIQNTAIAAAFISLKAVDLKLATCIVSVFDKNAIEKALKLPTFLHPVIIMTVGYQWDKYKTTKRHPSEYLTYFEEFSYAAKRRNDSTAFPLERKFKEISDRIKRRAKDFKKK
ncbi:MAG: nitroreductase family protein, partial [Nanoarchaeota archaeon]